MEQRIRSEAAAAQAVCAPRPKTAANVHADLKTHRGSRAFPVRGLARCRCVALRAVLACNVLHLAQTILSRAWSSDY
jgi:hypothetical protein